jgi:hypothetical protein
MLVIPVISSSEVRNTYVKMIANESDPARKEILRAEGEASIGAQKSREIFGVIFLSISGIFGLVAMSSIFMPKKHE